MPLSTCSSGLVVTALVALLLLPAQYYVPELRMARRGGGARPADPPAPPALAPPPPPQPLWPTLNLVYLPTLDLLFTCTLLVLGLLTYLCEWIQRKLMERRIVKLNQYLGASVARLRAWDAQQEQVETTLRMVHTATAEYNLLLLLLLRQHRCSAPASPHHQQQHNNCFFEKELDEEIHFLRNSTLET